MYGQKVIFKFNAINSANCNNILNKKNFSDRIFYRTMPHERYQSDKTFIQGTTPDSDIFNKMFLRGIISKNLLSYKQLHDSIYCANLAWYDTSGYMNIFTKSKVFNDLIAWNRFCTQIPTVFHLIERLLIFNEATYLYIRICLYYSSKYRDLLASDDLSRANENLFFGDDSSEFKVISSHPGWKETIEIFNENNFYKPIHIAKPLKTSVNLDILSEKRQKIANLDTNPWWKFSNIKDFDGEAPNKSDNIWKLEKNLEDFDAQVIRNKTNQIGISAKNYENVGNQVFLNRNNNVEKHTKSYKIFDRFVIQKKVNGIQNPSGKYSNIDNLIFSNTPNRKKRPLKKYNGVFPSNLIKNLFKDIESEVVKERIQRSSIVIDKTIHERNMIIYDKGRDEPIEKFEPGCEKVRESTYDRDKDACHKERKSTTEMYGCQGFDIQEFKFENIEQKISDIPIFDQQTGHMYSSKYITAKTVPVNDVNTSKIESTASYISTNGNKSSIKCSQLSLGNSQRLPFFGVNACWLNIFMLNNCRGGCETKKIAFNPRNSSDEHPISDKIYTVFNMSRYRWSAAPGICYNWNFNDHKESYFEGDATEQDSECKQNIIDHKERKGNIEPSISCLTQPNIGMNTNPYSADCSSDKDPTNAFHDEFNIFNTQEGGAFAEHIMFNPLQVSEDRETNSKSNSKSINKTIYTNPSVHNELEKINGLVSIDITLTPHENVKYDKQIAIERPTKKTISKLCDEYTSINDDKLYQKNGALTSTNMESDGPKNLTESNLLRIPVKNLQEQHNKMEKYKKWQNINETDHAWFGNKSFLGRFGQPYEAAYFAQIFHRLNKHIFLDEKCFDGLYHLRFIERLLCQMKAGPSIINIQLDDAGLSIDSTKAKFPCKKEIISATVVPGRVYYKYSRELRQIYDKSSKYHFLLCSDEIIYPFRPNLSRKKAHLNMYSDEICFINNVIFISKEIIKNKNCLLKVQQKPNKIQKKLQLYKIGWKEKMSTSLGSMKSNFGKLWKAFGKTIHKYLIKDMPNTVTKNINDDNSISVSNMDHSGELTRLDAKKDEHMKLPICEQVAINDDRVNLPNVKENQKSIIAYRQASVSQQQENSSIHHQIHSSNHKVSIHENYLESPIDLETTANSHPTSVGTQQSSASNQRITVSYLKAGANDRQALITSQKPQISNQETDVSSHQCLVSNQQTNVSDQQNNIQFHHKESSDRICNSLLLTENSINNAPLCHKKKIYGVPIKNKDNSLPHSEGAHSLIDIYYQKNRRTLVLTHYKSNHLSDTTKIPEDNQPLKIQPKIIPAQTFISKILPKLSQIEIKSYILNPKNNTYIKKLSNQNYKIYKKKILRNEDSRTTCMIKNIPNKYTQKMLMEMINEHHSKKYNFLYLRMDIKNRCNVGYAFINFKHHHHVYTFYEKLHGRMWKKFNSSKIAVLTYASIQGIESLKIRFDKENFYLNNEQYGPFIEDT